jgi:hypothetical protein
LLFVQAEKADGVVSDSGRFLPDTVGGIASMVERLSHLLRVFASSFRADEWISKKNVSR